MSGPLNVEGARTAATASDDLTTFVADVEALIAHEREPHHIAASVQARLPRLLATPRLPRPWVVERTQSQYLQSALDVQASRAHDRSRWVAEPARCGHPAAGSPAGLCVCSTGSWCAMSIVPSASEHLASAPPHPRERQYAVAGTGCRQPIGIGSCVCSVASSNGS